MLILSHLTCRNYSSLLVANNLRIDIESEIVHSKLNKQYQRTLDNQIKTPRHAKHL